EQASPSEPTLEQPPGLEVAQAHLDRSLQTRGLMVQPYVKSVETRGELSLIYIDGQFSHAIRKLPALGDYRVQEEYGGNDFPERPSAAALALGAQLMQAPPLTRPDGPQLYARLDLIEGDRGELMLVELELVEPSLFFRHHPQAAEALADALLRRL
ncbi:MAG: hypothetical protein ACPG77_17670, partial [Nannocystaceae bacterium]